jgi:hypothetical protein
VIDNVTAAFGAIFWIETFFAVSLVALAAYFALNAHH